MRTLFSRYPLVLQTAYAEIKRQAREQSSLLVGTPGSVGIREVKGSPFLYRQFYDAQGKKSADYFGPAGHEAAEAKAATAREQIALTKGLLKESRILAQQGYVRADLRTGAILAAITNRRLFEAGALLVGSHAFGALLNELGVQGAAYHTEDVDIARNDPLKIALPDNMGLLEVLRESTVPLNEIPPLNRKAPSTSYKPSGLDRLRVDLLVPTDGTEITILPVPELHAHATALPFLRYLLTEPLDAVILGREAVVPVRVPRPERLAWHKTLVSQLRGASNEKRGKDLQQAAILMAVLAEDAPDDLLDAFEAIPVSAKRKTLAGARQVMEILSHSAHERAAEWLAETLNASG